MAEDWEKSILGEKSISGSKITPQQFGVSLFRMYSNRPDAMALAIKDCERESKVFFPLEKPDSAIRLCKRGVMQSKQFRK